MKDSDPISVIHRIDKPHAQALDRLKIYTVRDILLYIPSRYTDSRESLPISHLVDGQSITVYGRIEKVKVSRSFKGHTPMTTCYLNDGNARIKLVFFKCAV